jgi:esterase/lipase superfamily enzyme
MFDVSPMTANLIILAVGALLYLFAWVWMGQLPRVLAVMGRLLLALILVAPIVLAAIGQFGSIRHQGGERPPVASAPSQPSAEAEQRRASELKKAADERAAAQAKRIAADAKAAADRVATAPPPPVVVAPAPMPTPAPATAPPPSPAPAPVTASPPAGGTRGLGTAGTPPPPAEVQSDWTSVPVFYGTNRNREDAAKRISYGADRAGRLELGRAIVTVPKNHQVPNVERPWSIRVPYFDIKIYEQAEDPKRHFTIQDIGALTQEQFLGFVRERLAVSAKFKDHAVVFVHGYNNSFDYAVYRTAQIAYDLDFDGAPFMYSWPSGGGVGSYGYDRESAEGAEPHLKDFMDLVVKQSGAKQVSVIAHSMGNLPLLRVLNQLKPSLPAGVQLNQIIMAAPDVDRNLFETLARDLKAISQGVTMYVSSNDRAMDASRRFAGGVPRAGDVPTDGPLIVQDIDTIDVTATSTDWLALNHSTYAERSALIDDISKLIRTGERPPEKRSQGLARKSSPKGDYWLYSAGR